MDKTLLLAILSIFPGWFSYDYFMVRFNGASYKYAGLLSHQPVRKFSNYSFVTLKHCATFSEKYFINDKKQ